MTLAAAAALLLVAMCGSACGRRPTAVERPARPSEASSVLGEGTAALVRHERVTWTEVDEAARSQGVGRSRALEAQVRDALFAEGALERGLDRSEAVQCAVRAALARSVLEEIRREVRALPPNDSEVAALTVAHFVELDRPESFRVIHALIAVSRTADAPTRARARAAAERLAKAVEPAENGADFERRAKSFDGGDPSLKVESLNPVAADGRVVDGASAAAGERYAPEFAKAASRLTEVGEKSPIVETDFGFHVLMLLERLPSHQVPLDERRRLLAEEVFTHRGRDRMDALVRTLRAARSPDVERAAEAWMSSLGPREP